MSNEKKIYTVKEAARVLGIGFNLAYKLAKTGDLPVLRLGRRMVVPATALDEMLTKVSK